VAQAALTETKPQMVTVRLARNHRPMERPNPEYTPNQKGDGKYLPPVFEVVGYWKDEIKRKKQDGTEVVVQKREFVKDEMAPSTVPGTGFASKLWANTVVRVLKDEAKYIRDNNIGTIEVDDD